MLFIHDTAQWLDDVDPWSDQEALDLFEAVRTCRTQGLFHCAWSADGETCYVMTAHATGVLMLASREAWHGLVLELGRRCGLATPMLVEAAPAAHSLPSRIAGPRPQYASAA